MSQFAFLQAEWPEVFEAALKTEQSVHSDPRAACFYARRCLEQAVRWVYTHDPGMTLPYRDGLSALLHDPSFKAAMGQAVFQKARAIKELGNLAVHGNKAMTPSDSLMAAKELFQFCFWLGRTYSRGTPPVDGLTFSPYLLPRTSGIPPLTLEHLRKLEEQTREQEERLSAILADKSSLDEELKRLRAEVAEARKTNEARPDTHDYSEAETRTHLIDLLLLEAGWPLDKQEDREFEVEGMPNAEGKGYVDYVLWGDDAKPLGLVEAKRTTRNPRVGQQQAKLYADCLERMYGQRPVIFYTNGYEHWIWDDLGYPPRSVQGFYKKAELEFLVQRRASRRPLPRAAINKDIVDRYYQTRAIRRVCEAFERDCERKALLVMATGTGKTRIVIALIDLLMRCNWIKRALFLADRVALVNQAVNAFKRHLPDASPVNLVTEKDTEGRVFVSTYPTMMGLIDETHEGQRRFGVGHFDLIVIDEAHRSVFQKYRAIFDYFDSLLVGLTATPKDEVDRNTYRLFDLENGVPTDAYSLEDAVQDKYLVPPVSVSVPLKFQREGIRYDDLSEDEKEQWDELDWGDPEAVPDRVEAEAVNKWLFNKDTVDKVLEHLMAHGLKVAGGDRLGKSIIFAKNNDHAEFIAERFNANYPHYKGEFARVITFKTEYAQSLIDSFSIKDKAPHIAISVDMLDTGIDVPEVVNLVFFKLVRSKTKFWQMIGRGTRLCPDLFGPRIDKENFFIFDFCQNLEFFNQNPETTDGNMAEPLGKRLFKIRLELIGQLDKRVEEEAQASNDQERALRQDIAELLRTEVAAMNLDNFMVRPKRRLVEKYIHSEAWATLKPEQLSELAHTLAGLPSQLDAEAEEAKRFDLLVLNLQLAILRAEHSFERMRDQIKAIAGLLEEKSSIPMVREQLPLILDVQTEEWWQDVTVSMLETLRKRLRALVHLIEKKGRNPVFTDFEDEKGLESTIELPSFGAGKDFEHFRAKARQFLNSHENRLAIHKLRHNHPLTPADLEELEKILIEAGGTSDDLNRAKQEHQGLGIFVRSLVGLDRQAAKDAFGQFLGDSTVAADQIEFVNMIIDDLTANGVMEPSRLYESPFTDINPLGPEGVFSSVAVDRIIAVLEDVRRRAAA